MITLVQLEYIVALDLHRHFATASEHCFVTQPTLSMQVKKLEDYLGVSIFDRTKQPIVPTEVGLKILEQAKKTLNEAKRISNIVAEYENTITGELSIGIIPSLAPYVLPQLVGKMTEKYPGLKLKVKDLLTEEIVYQLKRNELDAGILVTPLEEPELVEEPLFYEELLFLVNKNHPLAEKATIESKELASPDLWLLDSGHCFRQQVINLCDYKSQTKQANTFEYKSGSLETIKRIIELEGGYTVLPELAQELNGTGNSMLKPLSNRPVREVSIAFSRDYAKRKLISVLSEEVKACVPESMLNKVDREVVKWR